jgi:hypothetical protein
MTEKYGFETIDLNSFVWVLKYDMFENGVKFTDCHGFYRTEADAIKAMHKFAALGSRYYTEKVYERKLVEK